MRREDVGEEREQEARTRYKHGKSNGASVVAQRRKPGALGTAL